jgi:hypothetical protein
MDCSEGCPTAAVMFGVPRVRVLAAERDGGGLRLTVETDRWSVPAFLDSDLGRDLVDVSVS